MQIIEVTTNKHKAAFHRIQRELYRDDKNFVAPLEVLIENIFTPSRNEFFSHGKAIRFLLVDDDGAVKGRVASFINESKAYTYRQPTGGMGFFECINDRQAAFMLFDACKEWLSQNGMEAMDGPVNFGENDNYWGLLVEGFGQEPPFGMLYNPPCYRDFFEAYGFKMYFEQVTNLLRLSKTPRLPERIYRVAQWTLSKEGFEYKHFNYANVRKFLQDLKTVYDKAWRFHENFTPIDIRTIEKELYESRSIIDPQMIWFAYHNGEPIAFFIMFPDAGYIFKHFNGRLSLWNKLRFLFMKRMHYMKRTRITIMGVTPEYQRYGIESAIFVKLEEVMEKRPWIEAIELSWVGDFNPKMRAIHEGVGADFYQRHYTYRYLFDSTAEFERYTEIPVDTKFRQV
jgi:GNAT superfamily N-acetyltransferase